MVMGQGMQRQIAAQGLDPRHQPRGQIASSGSRGGPQMMIEGNSRGGGQVQIIDGAGGQAPNALTLFSTPHSLGGGGMPSNSRGKRLKY